MLRFRAQNDEGGAAARPVVSMSHRDVYARHPGFARQRVPAQLAAVERQQGQSDRALEHYTKAAALEPGDAVACRSGDAQPAATSRAPRIRSARTRTDAHGANWKSCGPEPSLPACPRNITRSIARCRSRRRSAASSACGWLVGSRPLAPGYRRLPTSVTLGLRIVAITCGCDGRVHQPHLPAADRGSAHRPARSSPDCS